MKLLYYYIFKEALHIFLFKNILYCYNYENIFIYILIVIALNR